MCVAKDALVRKGFRHKGRGDLDGPPEPVAVCAERIGGIDKCKCWIEAGLTLVPISAQLELTLPLAAQLKIALSPK